MNMSHSIMFDYMLGPYSRHSRCECGQYLGDTAEDEKNQKLFHDLNELNVFTWFSF